MPKRKFPDSIDERLATIHAYVTAKSAGKTNREAAVIAGVSIVTAWRWSRRYRAAGSEALAPRRRGRTPSVIRLGLNQATIRLLQEHRLTPQRRNSIHAVRLAIADRRCRRSQARILQPYARRGSRAPRWLEAVLRICRVPRVELRCGQFARLLAPNQTEGSVK